MSGRVIQAGQEISDETRTSIPPLIIEECIAKKVIILLPETYKNMNPVINYLTLIFSVVLLWNGGQTTGII